MKVTFEEATSRTTRHIISSVGSMIKLARKEKLMSVEELANRVGVGRNTIDKIENGGDVNIPIGNVIEAALIVGIPLFGGDREHIHNLSTMLGYMNKLIPERYKKEIVVKDNF